MSKPVLLSIGNGKVQELVGTANNDVLTWDSTLDGGSWKSAAGGGGGGSGTVTSVGLTGGTSGIVIGGTASPITTSGTFNLDAPLRFAFDTTTPTAVASAGQVAWNDTEGSLESMLKGGNVVASLGQQTYQRVVNAEASPITKGQIVYVFGSSGTRVSVKLALADADLTSAGILGVVAETIAASGTGFVMTGGLMKDLSVLPATSFADGDVVYLSATTAGALTKIKPTAPNHLVTVGYVAKASNGSAGELLVHPQNGYEIGELHDVYVSSPTSGQILIYDATAGQTRWENASLTGGTGVTVTPGAGSLSVAIGQAVGTGDSPTFASVTTTTQVNTNTIVTRTANTLAIDPFTGNTLVVQPTAASTPTRVEIYGGSRNAAGAGGVLLLQGGAATTGNNDGGSLFLAGGNPSGSGVVGTIRLTTTFVGLDPLTSGGTTFRPINATIGKTLSVSGGWSTATDTPGATLTLSGGNATVGNANGGALSIRGGAKVGTGTDGVVNIGTTQTGSVTIGATGIQTTINGTLSLANDLPVTEGGTGASSFTQYGVLVGAGTGAVQATAVGNSGEYLKSGAGSANPAFATIVVGEVSGAAPLASPTFTGTVTLPLTTAGYVKTTSGGVISSSATVSTSDLSGTVAVANGGTGAATTQANKVFAGPTTGADAAPSFRALVAADVAGLTPYDLSGEFVGTPASGATIMRFVAVRAFTLTDAIAAYFACTSNTGATTAVFTVNVAGVSKGTVSIAGNATSGTGTLTSTSVTAGQTVEVVATTPANVVNVWWTLPGTV